MRFSRLVPLFLLVIFATIPRAGAAEPGPAPSVQASPAVALAERDFLLLPAYDLEREESAPAKVGDRLRLELSGFPPEQGMREFRFSLPAGSASLGEQGWAIFSDAPDAKEASPRPVPEQLGLIAVPLKAGDLTLPSLAILNAGDSNGAGGKALARTNPLVLKVESALSANDKREPVALRPPVSLAFPKWIIALSALLAVALVAGVVYGLVWWSRSRKPVQAPLSAEPPRPADEVALKALAELERQGLAKSGNFKGHYFGVSEILKIYLGARYRFDAPESTSREIIGVLEERRAIDDSILDKLESLLMRLDLVKFTDHIPVGPEPALVLEDAREWIRMTRRPTPATQPVSAKETHTP